MLLHRRHLQLHQQREEQELEGHYPRVLRGHQEIDVEDAGHPDSGATTVAHRRQSVVQNTAIGGKFFLTAPCKC